MSRKSFTIQFIDGLRRVIFNYDLFKIFLLQHNTCLWLTKHIGQNICIRNYKMITLDLEYSQYGCRISGQNDQIAKKPQKQLTFSEVQNSSFQCIIRWVFRLSEELCITSTTWVRGYDYMMFFFSINKQINCCAHYML